MDRNPGQISCSLGHYHIYKICSLRKYRNVLIIEDDVVFLKDIFKIEEILENTPKDEDLVMYTHFTSVADKNSLFSYIQSIKTANENGSRFIRIGETGPDLGSTGTYSVSERFATILCGLQEKYLSFADTILNHPTAKYKCDSPDFVDEVLRNTRRCYCSTPISLQKYYMESATEKTIDRNTLENLIRGAVWMYRSCGIDIDQYNGFDEYIKDLI